MISSDQRPPGEDWLVRRIADLERQVRELQAGRRLEAATIGAGGLRVKGGNITVTENGSVIVSGGGDIEVLDGGSVSVSGGSVIVSGGGDIQVLNGGSVSLSGGSVIVSGGGDIQVLNGGTVHVIGGDVLVQGDGQVLVQDGGALRVVHSAPGNQVLLFAGPSNIGEPISSFEIRRPDGTLMMWAYGTDVGANGFWALYDEAQTIIVSEDGASGHGLATPPLSSGHFGTSFNGETVALLPGTTQGAFTSLCEGYFPLTHPRIRVVAYAASDDGVSGGEARVLLGGTQIGTTVAAGTLIDFTVPVPGWGTTRTFQQEQKLELQARRTSGTGRIVVQIYAAYGRQS